MSFPQNFFFGLDPSVFDEDGLEDGEADDGGPVYRVMLYTEEEPFNVEQYLLPPESYRPRTSPDEMDPRQAHAEALEMIESILGLRRRRR